MELAWCHLEQRGYMFPGARARAAKADATLCKFESARVLDSFSSCSGVKKEIYHSRQREGHASARQGLRTHRAAYKVRF
jgi:hypothetical protein